MDCDQGVSGLQEVCLWLTATYLASNAMVPTTSSGGEAMSPFKFGLE